MKQTLQLREKALQYLRTQQTDAGAFVGHASPNIDDFALYHEQPASFFTALILSCLHDQTGVSDLRQRAIGFLLQQKSDNWTWNYWLAGSDAAQRQPYPDDMDDTACALAALTQCEPAIVDGTVLGHFAQSLIATETTPGGPYNTWLIDDAQLPAWKDVDIAVNANIGFCLSLHEVSVPGLVRYVDEAIKAGALISSYYVGRVPVIYFLSRWYTGEALQTLRDFVVEELANQAHRTNPLMLALLLSSACRLSVARQLLQPSMTQLVTLRVQDHWSATALYYEPPVEGVLHYAGSEALTTAFVVEALALYDALSASVSRTAAKPPLPNTVTHALTSSKTIGQAELRRRYRAYLRNVARHDHDQQITAMATLTARACGRQLSAASLEHLNLASLHGWVAYSIYDDVLDDEPNPALLGVANFSLRETIRHFQAALPEQIGFQQLVAAVLNQVDGANTWEVTNARAQVQGSTVKLKRLPDYGLLTPLWQRSWGHMLAASGVLVALGYEVDGLEQQALQEFFQHFLIARQLNDDAHDWEDDLRRGHLTAVVTMLLHEHGAVPLRLKLEVELQALRVLFWQKTIVAVSKLITAELEAARTALVRCAALQDPTAYIHWLDTLEKAAEQALRQRQEAQKFMAAYAPDAITRNE